VWVPLLLMVLPLLVVSSTGSGRQPDFIHPALLLTWHVSDLGQI
jgi:hypothetical protein